MLPFASAASVNKDDTCLCKDKQEPHVQHISPSDREKRFNNQKKLTQCTNKWEAGNKEVMLTKLMYCMIMVMKVK